MSLCFTDQPLIPNEQLIKAESDLYRLFPTKDDIAYDNQTLLVFGLLDLSKLNIGLTGQIPIAVPASDSPFEGNDERYVYSKTSTGWALENADEFDCMDKYFVDEYVRNFHLAKQTIQNEGLPDFDSFYRDRTGMFALGGVAWLGCNWDAYKWGDNESNFEAWCDAIDEESHPEHSKWAAKGVAYQDDETGELFHYIGCIPLIHYVDADGYVMVFMTEDAQKVRTIFEFS